MFIDIKTVKKHLNIDDFFKEEDEYLNHLILVAEKVVERHIDRDFSTLLDKAGNLPEPLLHAMMLFIGDMYQSRESVSFASAQELPLSFQYLLGLYNDYSCDMSIKPGMPGSAAQRESEPEAPNLDTEVMHEHKTSCCPSGVIVSNIEVI